LAFELLAFRDVRDRVHDAEPLPGLVVYPRPADHHVDDFAVLAPPLRFEGTGRRNVVDRARKVAPEIGRVFFNEIGWKPAERLLLVVAKDALRRSLPQRHRALMIKHVDRDRRGLDDGG